jgi:hypothetical protein
MGVVVAAALVLLDKTLSTVAYPAMVEMGRHLQFQEHQSHTQAAVAVVDMAALLALVAAQVVVGLAEATVLLGFLERQTQVAVVVELVALEQLRVATAGLASSSSVMQTPIQTQHPPQAHRPTQTLVDTRFTNGLPLEALVFKDKS